MSTTRIAQISQCKVCLKIVAVTSLHRHMKTVHNEKIGKQIQCDQCGKILQAKDRLNQHKKSHLMNQAEEHVYSCDLCRYKTEIKAYMNDHKKRLHKSKPGVWLCMSGTCSENPKSFINPQQMSKHHLIHANVTCPDCNKCFGAQRNMKRHKVRDIETSRNSDESNEDENLNDDPLDTNNV